MKMCDICQGENPKKAKKCILCGNKFKKPIYKRGWFIFLIIICVWNVNKQINSYRREQALYNNSNFSVEGIFVLNDDWMPLADNTQHISFSKELADNETYAFIVYDLMNFTSANISISSFAEVLLTLNDENRYSSEDESTLSKKRHVYDFVCTSGFETEIPETISGYSKPIRLLSVYVINKSDIHDNTTATVESNSFGIYRAKKDFEAEDIILISSLEEILEIEDNQE